MDRRKTSRTAAVLAAALLMPTAAASAATADQAGPAADSVRAYSGEELYNALHFGVGPAAEGLGELTPSFDDPEAVAQAEKMSAIGVDHLLESDPAYFETFEEELTSGDRVRVDAALKGSGTETLTALADAGYDVGPVEDEIGAAIPAIAGPVLVVAVAVGAFNVWAAANVVTEANWFLSEPTSDNLLAQEEFINDLTVELEN